MSIEPSLHKLNGPTMGTRWTAQYHVDSEHDADVVRMALQAAVAEVDAQMSTWNPDSDLMRINAAPMGTWVPVPVQLLQVLALARDIEHVSGGAFDIGVGDAVLAWGFGPEPAQASEIQAAAQASRAGAAARLQVCFATGQVRKSAPITLDLNAIAKGYGVDRLAETLSAFGISDWLVGIDGDMRAQGLRADGRAWIVAIETPDPTGRAAHSVLALQDAAVATSGDYRHWVDLSGHRLSHTMDPKLGRPLVTSPASVTVVAGSCAQADAWATALMVLGAKAGGALAQECGLEVLFLLRGDGEEVRAYGVGPMFGAGAP